VANRPRAELQEVVGPFANTVAVRCDVRPDSSVHLGRLDHQVKIMGHRVELGEVEAVLRRHPDVAEAVAVTPSANGDLQLVVVYTGQEVPARELGRWVRDRLPVHMAPRRYHHVPMLPLNANGKVDRRHLTELVGP